jgi:hypothetical protein
MSATSATLRRPAAILAGLAVMLATLVVVTAGTAQAAAPYCGIRWGSVPKAGGTASEHPLGAVRTGRHQCFDRVVFELDGPADGYEVGYVSSLRTDGEGRQLRVAGGAILQVHLMANVFDQLGHQHYARLPGDHVANVKGYRTLRDVVYAGCFEGRTTFGVGTRARLPFRVFRLSGPGSHSRIVVDVAHRW